MEVASGPCDKAPDGRRGYLVKATVAAVALLLPEVLGSRPSKRAVRGLISPLAPTVDQRCEQVDHRGQQVYHRSRKLQRGEKDLYIGTTPKFEAPPVYGHAGQLHCSMCHQSI